MLDREKLIHISKLIYETKTRKKKRPLDFFKPLSYQESFWTSRKKIKLVCGGNRSGKTHNGASYVVHNLKTIPNYEAMAVTWADLSIPVQQRKVHNMLSLNDLDYCKYSEQNGFANRIVTFKNGSVLRFKTYDQGRESFQGTAKDLIWNDEEPPEDVYREEKARLIDKDGEMILTMTPLKGMTWIYKKLVINKEIENLIDVFFWNTELNTKINLKAFKNIIGTYAEKEALARSKGIFTTLTEGRLYYAFDRSRIIKSLRLNNSLPIRLSFDFNVNPMTTIIAQIVPGQKTYEQEKILNILRVVSTSDCNTKKQCQILLKLLENWNGDIIIYGDASNQRRTETADVNDTNWTYVKQYFPDANYFVPTVNPNIKERIGWSNAKIINFDDQIGLYINSENCDPLISDLEQGIWSKDGKTKDKSNNDLNHCSDAMDYIIAQEFKLFQSSLSFSELIYENDNEIGSFLNIEY